MDLGSMNCKFSGLSILDAIKNIFDLWEEVKISTLTGVWKKLIPNLMGDFEKIKTSVEEVTRDVVEIAKGLELGEKPRNLAEFLQDHDKTLFLLMTDQYSIKWMHCICLYVFTCWWPFWWFPVVGWQYYKHYNANYFVPHRLFCFLDNYLEVNFWLKF